MTTFTASSIAASSAIVLAAAAFRGRAFAAFGGVLLSVHTAVSCALFPRFAWCAPVFVYLQIALYLHFASLVRARLRPLAYRALVSVPASWFSAGTMLAIPWAIAEGLHHPLPYVGVPYAIALVGLVQSLVHRAEEVDVTLDAASVPELRRHPRGDARVDRPLRVVQITDPHLGPFMPEERLRRLCERAVAHQPDLVLLTGDFLTMESHGAHESLSRALAPLAKLDGRVIACFGNHDHEDPATVRRALASIGATLLVDDATVVETPAGPVQIVGMDYARRDRRARMGDVCARHPRLPGHLRVVLLHDPGAFAELGEGEGDLVFSGHTHGGQLGLLVLGLPYTVVSAFSRIPDHGLWALGKNRLYVHRGSGHYGFPLRVGVPSEESLVRVHAPVVPAARGDDAAS